ncbi:MAG: DUF998 domain-containing protein [Chloroflexi bacterium]|nr:MAG: DUF998 domain-containing protein [Chloroflexota bacterium]
MIRELRSPIADTGSSARSIITALLACGAVAGPLFIAVGFIQIPLRAGFDWTRHPLSMLSLGDLGSIQVTNFVVCGLLFIAGAFGMRRVLRGETAGTWGPLLTVGVGLGLIVGGVFSADPGYGFPPGAPAGAPAAMSWHAPLHFAGFAIGFTSLVIACFVFARRYWKLGQRSWALYCIATGVVVAACFATVMSGLTHNLLPLWFALVVGWVWASAMPARLLASWTSR